MTDKQIEPIYRELTAKLSREAVRYAVQLQMFCPECDVCLDVDRAILVTSSRGAGILCEACMGKALRRVLSKLDSEHDRTHTLAECLETLEGRMEVDYGRAAVRKRLIKGAAGRFIGYTKHGGGRFS